MVISNRSLYFKSKPRSVSESSYSLRLSTDMQRHKRDGGFHENQELEITNFSRKWRTKTSEYANENVKNWKFGSLIALFDLKQFQSNAILTHNLRRHFLRKLCKKRTFQKIESKSKKRTINEKLETSDSNTELIESNTKSNN